MIDLHFSIIVVFIPLALVWFACQVNAIDEAFIQAVAASSSSIVLSSNLPSTAYTSSSYWGVNYPKNSFDLSCTSNCGMFFCSF